MRPTTEQTGTGHGRLVGLNQTTALPGVERRAEAQCQIANLDCQLMQAAIRHCLTYIGTIDDSDPPLETLRRTSRSIRQEGQPTGGSIRLHRILRIKN